MKKGFTLIELLVVVLIIGILAAIALPQYNKAVAKSRMAEAMVNGKAFMLALERHYLMTSESPTFESLDIELQGAVNTGANEHALDHITHNKMSYEIGNGGKFIRIVPRASAGPIAGMQLHYHRDGQIYCYSHKAGANVDFQESVCKTLGGTEFPSKDTANHSAFKLQ
ncbi:PilE-like protein [Elusimicrobium minutum Pei191]|uniref:PilE-like protein n=1 Tax=Elusimicrobium minutum (strain Pei191) TaxID=445932 RepID=B2KEU7_ELUMP|nr:prepilin-type N-terminal cleavage/methylation domain-containing protein [Elusimicrobium minutum]ACC99043.1 PilE-like protein [Elusimicrobium minutum Pei191]